MSTFRHNRSTSVHLAALAAIASALSTGVLHAAPADNVAQVTVTYADLDLSKSEGADTLYRRLTQAARIVCAPYEGRDLKGRQLWNDCYEDAIGEALATLGNPMLTDLHRPTRG